MCTSGARTGMVAIAAAHRLILPVLRVGLTAYSAVAAGTAMPGAVALLIALTTPPLTAITFSGSALSSPSNVTIFPYLLDFTRIYRLMPSVHGGAALTRQETRYSSR
jgi:hypothetical protein